MSGHSRWSNIKHRKEKSDAQRGKLFTKIGREIAVAVKAGGADPEANSKLKDVIAKAKLNNLPNENITRSIKKASGDLGNQSYEEIAYEGYGPRGVAVIVETLTENKNRTGGDMRHYFDKFGGNLGAPGCVSFMFDKRGIIVIEKSSSVDEDTLMLHAVEAGAEDFLPQDEYFEIITSVQGFSAVREALEKHGYAIVEAEVSMVPQTTVELTDEKDLIMMNKLIDHLDDHDDVQNVYHNWNEGVED